MASSVNRRIEGYLPRVMGQRDPAGLIRPRSTEPIRACGRAPRHQAGHMTAIGLRCRHVKKSLRAGGHPHMTRYHAGLPGLANFVAVTLIASTEIVITGSTRRRLLISSSSSPGDPRLREPIQRSGDTRLSEWKIGLHGRS